MAMMFTIIGDSNVKRHMNPLSCRDRPLMSGAQLLFSGRLEVLSESINQIRAESTVCLFACVTNFLTKSDGSSTVSLRVEPVLNDFLSKIQGLRVQRPDLTCLVCPPMYREFPLWYRENLPQILTKFSEVFRRQSDILLMPSFATPDFESDGVHLTAYSGMEFALYLFDTAQSVIQASSSDLETKFVQSSEATRVLEDRVMAIEKDHQRLNKFVEWKTAVDSELSEYHENMSFENWFVIHGLAKLDSKMGKKEWQEKAKSDVNGALSILMGREYPIVVVQNITSKAKDAICRYQVLMTSMSDSKEIRDTFGKFFLGGKGRDVRPEALKHISIQNRMTPGTQLRISLLKLMAKRYETSNKGGSAIVITYQPRPLIKIFPPEDAKDSRIKTFTYIEAIKNLPVNFRESDLRPILEKVNSKLKGTLKSVFVVVSDDMLPRKGKAAGAAGSGPSGSGAGPESRSGSGSKGGRSGGRGEKRGPSVSPSDSSKGSKSSKSSKN